MKKITKRLFIFIIIAMMSIPMIALLGYKDFGKLYGGQRDYKKPEVFFEGYEVGKFQKPFEDWFGRYFFGRNFLIKLRNTIYFLGNFKYFDRQWWIILSKQNEILGNNREINHHISNPLHRKGFEQSFKQMAYIQKELEKRGKILLFIMGANNIALYADKVEKYIKYFNEYNQIDRYTIYKKHLDENEINYFDVQEFFVQLYSQTGIEPISFTDSHWNRYGAGMVMIETLKQLKNKYKTKWDIPTLKEVKWSNTPAQYDRSIADRLNLFFKYRNNYNFPYIVYGNYLKENQNIKVSLLGDSFTEEYRHQLTISKFILAKNGFIYANHFKTGIPDNNIKKIINDSDIIMFIFIEPQVMTSHQINMINSLYNYFQKENKQK